MLGPYGIRNGEVGVADVEASALKRQVCAVKALDYITRADRISHILVLLLLAEGDKFLG